MANNRLWAVCKDDNEARCLAKSYGDWAGGFNSQDTFFTAHLNCPSNHGGDENILFVTENEDAGGHVRVKQFDFSDHNHVHIYLN